MVKNKHGGNRHKKMASKNQKPQSFTRKIRYSKSTDEIYAKVEKVYGGNRALVVCDDGRERIMEWRRKFSGRNKRDNFIGEGVLVLVGKREWQLMDTKKKEKVDLLEVYSQNDMEEIKKKKVCPSLFEASANAEEEDTIEITNKGAEEEYSWSKVEENSSNNIENMKVDLGDEEVSWDDI